MRLAFSLFFRTVPAAPPQSRQNRYIQPGSPSSSVNDYRLSGYINYLSLPPAQSARHCFCISSLTRSFPRRELMYAKADFSFNLCKAVCLLALLSAVGCSSYNPDQHCSAVFDPDSSTLTSSRARPTQSLIFPPVRPAGEPLAVVAQHFGRAEWPVTYLPDVYTTRSETITYRQYYYSSEHGGPHTKPGYRYHRRLHTWRRGQMVR